MDWAKIRSNGTIGALIVDCIERYAERIVLIQDDRSITYRDLGAQIAKAIGLFKKLGLQPGDPVAQLSGNRPDVVAIIAAAYIYGLRSVTLHATAGIADHVHVLADCGPKLFIGEKYYAERVRNLQAQSPQIPHWYSHDADDSIPSFWHEAALCPTTRLEARTSSEDIIRLAYTGGTTGRAKGVMLSDRTLMTNTLSWLAGIPLPDGVRYLCPAPVSHGAGSLVFSTLARGGCAILLRGFNVETFVDAARKHQPELTWLVPTMIYDLIDKAKDRAGDLASIRALVYSAAPAAPARLREALDMLGPVLIQSYGQTEAPNTVLMLNQNDHVSGDIARLSSAGKPYPGVQVALLDDDGNPVADGQAGEICVRGSLVMSGYWQQPEQTAETLKGDWLHTGDVGYRDADGFYFIVDRKKDMIISGGFNVYPREIEDVLTQHPDVAAAAVYGIPDPKWGEAVTACVRLHAGATVSTTELIALVRQHKGPVHAPKSLAVVEEIPLTPLGKPDKRALRQAHHT
ncbi:MULTISPECIES: AMP-binding protein [unclassified Beijerinckia]|uniref:AMP-binding protein n=1 Tax=unclassified Beijerinckia TaxID=2638183 RepID=UPI000896E551|nr:MULTISPECIES: AMP-binding protein [unclassified Beijerinckia]MDH7794283.1 fatty-acyl-CoA synthase [Beijerinckia sp. GAS462]SEB57744.1 fatty-acyl-CoA synthase [Beijerinckia sp. 28-YEA-48]